MADTGHKAPLIVRTDSGAFVEANSLSSVTFDPEGIAVTDGAVAVPDVGTCLYVAGVAPGETDITVTDNAGRTGTTHLVVEPEGLVLTFGDPVPR